MPERVIGVRTGSARLASDQFAFGAGKMKPWLNRELRLQERMRRLQAVYREAGQQKAARPRRQP